MADEEDAVEEEVEAATAIVAFFSRKNLAFDLFPLLGIFFFSRLEALRHPKRFRKVLPLDPGRFPLCITQKLAKNEPKRVKLHFSHFQTSSDRNWVARASRSGESSFVRASLGDSVLSSHLQLRFDPENVRFWPWLLETYF